MTTDYVAIIVHKDVLANARDIEPLLVEHYGLTYEDLAPLRDLFDPLPEPDVNGVTPRIVYNVQPEVWPQAIRDEEARS